MLAYDEEADVTASGPEQQRTSVRVDDLGPANATMYCLMSGLQVGGLFFIGSRNVTPSQVIAYDIAARSVVAQYDLGPGRFVQALAASPDGTMLYAGLVGCDGGEPNLWALDVGAASGPARAVATFPRAYVRTLAVAADGMVYAVGRHNGPALWAYDPQRDVVERVVVPDPRATETHGVAATESTVYFGSGSSLAGGAGASRSEVWALERASGTCTSIQPAALAGDPAARAVLVADGLLFVGTQGAEGTSHLAVIPLDDPSAAKTYEIEGKSVSRFHRVGDQVYMSGKDIHVYDLTTRSLAVAVSLDGSERWGLGVLGRELVCVSARGSVLHVDLDSGAVTDVDLITAGAPARAQLGMSIATDAAAVYIGGNGSVIRRPHARPDTSTRILVPGEAKKMIMVGDDVLMGVYNSEGVWRYRADGQLARIARLPVSQNRPQDCAWDADRSVMLVGSENDTDGGGSLAVVGPDDGSVSTLINPFGEQLVRAVAVTTDVYVIGGWNRYPTGPRGEIAAVDPESLAMVWRLDPDLGAGISCLQAMADQIVGLTVRGTAFAVETQTGRLSATRDLSALAPGLTRMVQVGSRVVVGSTEAVFRLGPDLSTEVLAEGLAGEWYSGPAIAADPDGNLYTLRRRNLVRLTTVGAPTRTEHQ